MSAEVQESSGKRGKGKQKKMTVRVDFTPMVPRECVCRIPSGGGQKADSLRHRRCDGAASHGGY